MDALVSAYGNDSDSSGEEENSVSDGASPLDTLQRSIDHWLKTSSEIPDAEDEARRQAVVEDLQRLCDAEWNQPKTPGRTERSAHRAVTVDTPSGGGVASTVTTGAKRPLEHATGAAASPQKSAKSSSVPDEGVCVRPFGSWHYGLHVRSSDIDLNVWAPAPIPGFFVELARLLASLSPPVALTVNRRARIPNAHFTLRGLSVDVVHECGRASDYEHSLSVSRWVRSWISKFPNLAGVCRIVKCWASARAINRSYANTLPSLALLVMLFHVAEGLAAHASEPTFPARVLSAFYAKFAKWPRKVRLPSCGD